MDAALRVRLTGRAARFVSMLQDFGHLDEEREQDLFVTLAELAGSPEEALVDLPVVRRVAAAVLFSHGGPDALRELEVGVLGEDWPVLFS